jgi:hypothetical protein
LGGGNMKKEEIKKAEKKETKQANKEKHEAFK